MRGRTLAGTAWHITRQAAERCARPRAAATLAGLVALTVYLLWPSSRDAASHLYQTQVFAEEGWRLWDNLWYGGRYSQVGYSLTYYPLAALIGTAAAVTIGAAGAAGAFASVVRRQWPRLATGPAVVFALMVALPVISGTYPFLLALLPALGAIMAVQRRRPAVASLLAALTVLTHPLAFAFLVAVLAGAALATPGWWRRGVWIHLAVGLATVGVAQLLLSRAFTAPGSHYPFDAKGLLAIGGFCAIGAALTRGSRDQRLLKMMFGAYASMAVVAYAVSSPLGGNAGRLLLFMGTPLILLPLAARGFRPRGAAALIVAATVSWQTVPVMTGWSATASARAPSREFWFPVEAFLDRHADPSYRVEVVATSHTWEAYYLARRGVPLARGWYRQDDWPENAALYKPLTIPAYHAWLRRMAVRYVLVPNDPLDTFTLGEVDRIRNGPGLDLAARVGGWSIYELQNPTPIATPRDGARVRSLTAKGLTLAVSRPGTYRLRLRYTPYWRVSRGVACVAPRGPFDTELRVAEAGTVRLDFRVGARTVVRTALGAAGAPCDNPGRPAAVAQRAR